MFNNEVYRLMDAKEKLEAVNLITDFFNLQKAYMTCEINQKLLEVRFKSLVDNFINEIKVDLSNPFIQLVQL